MAQRIRVSAVARAFMALPCELHMSLPVGVATEVTLQPGLNPFDTPQPVDGAGSANQAESTPLHCPPVIPAGGGNSDSPGHSNTASKHQARKTEGRATTTRSAAAARPSVLGRRVK